MFWPKKIHTRSLLTKKIPAARKFPSPPHNFSNGPSLKYSMNIITLVLYGALSTDTT